MNNKCCGLAGLIFGHDFEPQFNTVNSPVPADSGAAIGRLSANVTECDTPDGVLAVAEAFKVFSGESTIYAGSVCIRCGATTKI